MPPVLPGATTKASRSPRCGPVPRGYRPAQRRSSAPCGTGSLRPAPALGGPATAWSLITVLGTVGALLLASGSPLRTLLSPFATSGPPAALRLPSYLRRAPGSPASLSFGLLSRCLAPGSQVSLAGSHPSVRCVTSAGLTSRFPRCRRRSAPPALVRGILLLRLRRVNSFGGYSLLIDRNSSLSPDHPQLVHSRRVPLAASPVAEGGIGPHPLTAIALEPEIPGSHPRGGPPTESTKQNSSTCRRRSRRTCRSG